MPKKRHAEKTKETKKRTEKPGHKIELLAPAGSYESLMAGINAGADAVYFGITQLNMRARAASNFTFEDLRQIADTCHKHNVRCYLTLNTILYDHDTNLAKKILDAAKENEIDAVITADMAALMYGKEIGQEIHISTQLSVSNVETVKFYSQFADTIVLARELTLPMMKHITEEIKKQDIRGPKGRLVKIEVFGHGAMCVAISGRCHMSLLTDNSSANRGACKQPCRRLYTITDENGKQLKVDNEFVMSPQDLSTIGLLDKLQDAGINVLKIEGRGRAPEYVDTVISTYREAIDSIEKGEYTEGNIQKWNKKLGTVYNRGMNQNYYLGQTFTAWSGVHGSNAEEKREFLGRVINYYPRLKVVEIQIDAGEISSTDKFIITGPSTGVVRGDKPEIWLDEKKIKSAEKGDRITFKLDKKVKPKDKLYKLIQAK